VSLVERQTNGKGWGGMSLLLERESAVGRGRVAEWVFDCVSSSSSCARVSLCVCVCVGVPLSLCMYVCACWFVCVAASLQRVGAR